MCTQRHKSQILELTPERGPTDWKGKNQDNILLPALAEEQDGEFGLGQASDQLRQQSIQQPR